MMAEIAGTARRMGTEVDAAIGGTEALTENLSMTTYLPKAEVRMRQRTVVNRLYAGEEVNDALVFLVSKERNQASLMHGFRYAGRTALLCGDRYGFDWEEEPIPPCDLIKLPHHGDIKSMTRALTERLHPSVTVISCQTDPKRGKERPDPEMLRMVQGIVPTVLCTENRELPTLRGATHNGMCCTIADDGTLAWKFE